MSDKTGLFLQLKNLECTVLILFFSSVNYELSIDFKGIL